VTHEPRRGAWAIDSGSGRAYDAIMNAVRLKRVGLWTMAALVLLALGAVGLEGSIRLYARSTGNHAAARFGGDRVTGLARLVDCEGCSLKERDMAVWALGEVRDRRALTVLRAHYTGARCNHAADLCQYELGKAIMKIEGTWAFHSARAPAPAH
jgi:hypothetical protein